MDTLNDLLARAWTGPGLALILWPILGLLAVRILEAGWMLAALGRGLAWARAAGVGLAHLPKGGAFRILFAPLVYLAVYGIAVAMALVDGILSGSDPHVQALAGRLVFALRKAGAPDPLLYLSQKTAEPAHADAVATLSQGLALGIDPRAAADVAARAALREP